MLQVAMRLSKNLGGHMRTGWWLIVALVLLAVLVGAGVYGWRSGRELQELANLGYPGIFLVMLISGGSIFFPAPGQAAVLAAGALWNPILVGLAAGLGNATGELTGYVAGRAGAKALTGREAPRWLEFLRGWLRRHGFFAILLLAMVPNPVFDAIGVLVGSLAYPARRFWLACALGNSVKYIGVAYLGEAASWLLV